MQVVGLVLLFVAASIVDVVASNAPNFMVGTVADGSDVVWNGETTAAWSGSGSVSPYFVNATLTLPTFFLSINDTRAQDALAYNITLLNSNPSFYLTTSDQTVGILEGGSGRSHSFFANIVCVNKDSFSTGQFQITFPGTDYTPVTIQFAKRCLWPKLNVGSHGTAGFVASVVDQGVAVDYNFTATTSEDFTNFYIWLDASEDASQIPSQPFTPTALFSSSVMKVSLVSTPNNMAYTLADSQDAPVQLQISFNCITGLMQSNTAITVDLAVGFNQPLTFQLHKVCAGAINPRIGLNVGLTPGGSEVVSNGIVTSRFLQSPGPVLGPGVLLTAFYYTLAQSASYNNSQLLNISTTDVSSTRVFLFDALAGKMQVAVNVPLQYESSFYCLQQGTGALQGFVQLPLFDDLLFYFQFSCVQPLLTVAVNASSSPNATVIDNSNSTTSGTNAQYTVGADDEFTVFQVSLKGPATVTSQVFEVDFSSFEAAVLSPSVMTVPVATLTKPSFFILSYSCNPELVSLSAPNPRVTRLSLSLSYGWEVEPIFSVTKLCPTVLPNSGKSSSSWTPAGIFFFTLFLLIVAVFLGKMAYNYFMLHERGLEMVPGIAYYRRCYNWCVGTPTDPHYGPQMDQDTYDATAASHDYQRPLTGQKSYGSSGSYQTDL